jgi:hypothetical protein
MLVPRRIIHIPARKIILDLALRSGSPDREAVCPYNGRRNDFMHNLAGDARYAHMESLPFLDMQADFLSEKVKPISIHTSRTKEEFDAIQNYNVNLEDIDESWVYKYFDNIMYRLKEHNANTVKKAASLIEETNWWADTEDSGVIHTEKDDQIRETNYSALDLMKWSEKIPYLLRRLHERSKECSIGIFSLLVSYEKIRKKREHNVGTAREAKASEVLAAGVYFMNKQGFLTTRVLENKGNKWNPIWRWIQGRDGFRDDYFYNAMELLDILDRLEIDIKNEDPFNYQEDFISKLDVSHIIDNRDFMLQGRNFLNKKSIQELKRMPLENYGRVVEEERNESRVIYINNLMQEFIDYNNPNYIDKRTNMIDSIMLFIAIYNVKMKTKINLAKKAVRNGVYMESPRIPVLIDVRPILTNKEIPQSEFLVHSAFINTCGYLVLDYYDDGFYYLDIETALAYIKDSFYEIDRHKRYGTNFRFGTWKGPAQQ